MTKESLRDALGRTGLLGIARRLRRTSALLQRGVNMRFPTYPDAIQRRVAGGSDPVRLACMALAIQTIERSAIPGDIAEVGVYQGHTSRFLSECAPQRRLFLFDTFEGFPLEHREAGNAADSRFQDTSEEIVRRIVGDRGQVFIRRGRFPDTATGLEDHRFSFVLLDLDVLAPTVAGLEFFYPRMSRGGYVFVHDYNSPESNAACSRALNSFLADKPELPIEIPDEWGSATFRKS